MVAKIIQCLKKKKLDEVIIRIAQLDFEQLQQLILLFLDKDYKEMIERDLPNDEIEYHFDLPRAYILSFYLYEDKGAYIASAFFSTNIPGQFYDEEENTLHVFNHRRVYAINLVHEGDGWELECVQGDKKKLFHLLKEFV